MNFLLFCCFVFFFFIFILFYSFHFCSTIQYIFKRVILIIMSRFTIYCLTIDPLGTNRVAVVLSVRTNLLRVKTFFEYINYILVYINNVSRYSAISTNICIYKNASPGNRTRIYCLEGNNANHYTSNAFLVRFINY